MAGLISFLEKLLLPTFLIGSMAAMGMGLTFRAILAALGNTRFVLATLVLNFAFAPALAWLLTLVIPLQGGHAAGLLLLGCAAGAPFLPKVVEVARGDLATAGALMVLLTVGTIVFMPLAAPHMIAGLPANPRAIAEPLVWFILVPLAVGLIIGSRAASFARRAAPVFAGAGNLSLLLIFGLLLARHARALLGIFGSGAILAVILFVILLFVAGWTLGGPRPEQRGVLALGTAGRNFGAALVPAGSNLLGPELMLMVLVSAIVSVVFCFLAAFWARRRVTPRMA